MAASGLPVERLRDYLRQLPPAAQSLLIAELERAALRGDDIPGGDALLQEVRDAVREAGISTPRIGSPARLFFAPLAPFLVDDHPAHKHQGLIARDSLESLWLWVRRDLVPEEARIYCDAVTRTLLAEDVAGCDRLTSAFHDRVVERIRASLAAVQSDDKALRRLIGQVGTPKALEDVVDLLTILSARDTFAMIEERLPVMIRNFADTSLDQVKALLDSPLAAQRDLLPYTLVLVMGRLAAPWQLIRLAIKAAESDDEVRIIGTPYAAAVTLTLADVERMVNAVKTGLRRGASAAVTSLIKSIHDAVRGLRSELDMAGDLTWGRQLQQIRADISALLKTEIESMPGRVRRLLRPRPSSEIVRGSVLDADEVADTEALLEFVGACRNYAGELAINEMTLRTYNELQLYLDTGTQALLDGLRNAGEGDGAFRRSQVDAAVRFCAKVFGRDYAALISKAAEVAAHANSERRASAARG
jgi:hypothetical protein